MGLVIHAFEFQRLFEELGGALPCFVIEIDLADLEVRSRRIVAVRQTLVAPFAPHGRIGAARSGRLMLRESLRRPVAQDGRPSAPRPEAQAARQAAATEELVSRFMVCLFYPSLTLAAEVSSVTCFLV